MAPISFVFLISLITLLTGHVDASPLKDAAMLERRQGMSLMSFASWIMPSVSGKFIQMRPDFSTRPDAQRSLLRFGPYTLPAHREQAGSSPHMATSNGGTKGAHDGGHDGGHGKSSGEISENGGMSWFSVFKTFAGLNTMDPNGLTFMKRLATPICRDCTVLRVKVRAAYENGTSANVGSGVYVHHAFVVDTTKKTADDVSNCKDIMASLVPFAGSDMDEHYQYFTTPDGKFPSGYYIKDHTMMLQAESVNYRTTKQSVYIDIDVEYLPGKVGNDVRQHVLAATKCGNTAAGFKAMPNTTGEFYSPTFDVLRDGHILAARGHLHDGGTGVGLVINDKLMCNSEAVYGGKDSSADTDASKKWESISSMTGCEKPVPVRKGDKLKLKSTYDLVKHPVRKSQGAEQDMMALLSYSFVPAIDE